MEKVEKFIVNVKRYMGAIGGFQPESGELLRCPLCDVKDQIITPSVMGDFWTYCYSCRTQTHLLEDCRVRFGLIEPEDACEKLFRLGVILKSDYERYLQNSLKMNAAMSLVETGKLLEKDFEAESLFEPVPASQDQIRSFFAKYLGRDPAVTIHLFKKRNCFGTIDSLVLCRDRDGTNARGSVRLCSSSPFFVALDKNKFVPSRSIQLISQDTMRATDVSDLIDPAKALISSSGTRFQSSMNHYWSHLFSFVSMVMVTSPETLDADIRMMGHMCCMPNIDVAVISSGKIVNSGSLFDFVATSETIEQQLIRLRQIFGFPSIAYRALAKRRAELLGQKSLVLQPKRFSYRVTAGKKINRKVSNFKLNIVGDMMIVTMKGTEASFRFPHTFDESEPLFSLYEKIIKKWAELTTEMEMPVIYSDPFPFRKTDVWDLLSNQSAPNAPSVGTAIQ